MIVFELLRLELLWVLFHLCWYWFRCLFWFWLDFNNIRSPLLFFLSGVFHISFTFPKLNLSLFNSFLPNLTSRLHYCCPNLSGCLSLTSLHEFLSVVASNYLHIWHKASFTSSLLLFCLFNLPILSCFSTLLQAYRGVCVSVLYHLVQFCETSLDKGVC